MDIKAINTAIVTGKFSIADLDSIADAVKFARSRIVNHVKVQGMTGTVLKVKIKKADVDFNGKIYQVPLSMCQVV
jgi:hypothetical protein